MHVIGVLILGGVAAESTARQLLASFFCEHHSLISEVNQKEGRQIHGTK